MTLVCSLELTRIICLNSINRFVFVMKRQRVFCEVRNKSLNIKRISDLRPCDGSAGYSLESGCGGPGSIRGQSTSDLWCMKRYWYRFILQVLRLYPVSTIPPLLHTLLHPNHFKAYRLLYVPACLKFKNSACWLHFIYVSCLHLCALYGSQNKQQLTHH
jgi:hypothetical protein